MVVLDRELVILGVMLAGALLVVMLECVLFYTSGEQIIHVNTPASINQRTGFVFNCIADCSSMMMIALLWLMADP
jgi:hypothetical protein